MQMEHTIWLFVFMWIQTISADCPVKECECLDSTTSGSQERVIDCRDKSLLGIPTFNTTQEIFQEITFAIINRNSINNNNIIQIADDAFQGLKVRKIDLSGNYLTQVTNNAFRGLESYLTDLTLEGNAFVPVPFNSLANLVNLKVLELEHFRQPDITSLPQNFSNLETLVLQTLQLTSLTSLAVSGKLRLLKRLEIKDNPNFTNFPTSTIRLLTNIEHLSFVQNGLTLFPTIGNAFALNTKFTELDLSHNNIDTLQPGCFDSLADKLKYLGLNINNLDGSKLGPLAAANWANLETLNLDLNNFGTTGIPTNLFKNMPNLAYLNLQECSLTHIERNDFEGLSNLLYLHLSGPNNGITQIDAGTFLNTPKLKELYMTSVGQSGNKLNFTANNAAGLENLEVMDLTSSFIEPVQFWSALSVMTGLKQLTLYNNGLLTIPNLAFQNNKKLEYLSIRSNGLTEVTQAQIHGLGSSFTTLDLQGNNIKVIDKCVVTELTNITQLFLANNPFQCDCKLLDFYDWLQARIAKYPDLRLKVLAKCSTPSSLAGKYLIGSSSNQDLSRDQLVCTGTVQPIQCQTFTTTTTSTTTTQPTTTTTPTPSLPIITMSFKAHTLNGVEVSWTVVNTNYLDKFLISKEQLGVGSTPDLPQQFDSSARSAFISLPNPGQDYRICISAKTTIGITTVPQCKIAYGLVLTTSPPPTGSPPSKLTGGEIAGIAAGCTILVILIVVIIVFLLRFQSKPKKYKDTPPVQFTTVARPAVGYDSKRFSKPKKGPNMNGDLIVSAISSGKTGPPSSPSSRHSDGSYQYLNENQMVNTQPHLNYIKGANGTSHDVYPPSYQNGAKQRGVQGYLKESDSKPTPHEKASQSRYDKTPGQGHIKSPAPKMPHYVNDPNHTADTVYTNDIQNRPLPKPRIKHYENNNSGFLNHGYDVDSPTESAPNSPQESTYHEINIETEI